MIRCSEREPCSENMEQGIKQRFTHLHDLCIMASDSPRLTWAAEVEWSHEPRLTDIARSRGVRCSVRALGSSAGSSKRGGTLILSDCNLTGGDILPVECYKYITRVFSIPHCTHDPYWFRVHPEVQELVRSGATVRIQAVPKAMELNVAEALIGDEDNVNDVFPGIKPENIKPSDYTHIFQCVFDESTNLFHWGISSMVDSIALHLTSMSLNTAVQEQHTELGIVPICRAYYKMKEMLEHYFPMWGWELPPDTVAVDVGASPGGWTQYLAVEKKCKCVVAIDPGELHESLLAPGSNVVNVRAIAQAPEVAWELMRVGGFQLCVCDVNFEADDATVMLVEHVLQYANVTSSSAPPSPTVDVADPDARQVCFTNSAEDLPLGREKETYKSRLTPEDLCHCCTHSDRGTGYLILTLKMPKNPKEKHMLRAVAAAMKLLAPAKNKFAAKFGVCGWDFKVVHLNANSKNERTLVCKFHNIPKCL